MVEAKEKEKRIVEKQWKRPNKIKQNYFVFLLLNDTEDAETHKRNEATLALAFFISQ